jgi:hypothetical protein
VNPQRSGLVRGVFSGLFVGIGILVTIVGWVFSQVRATTAVTGYVYELIGVGVLSLIIGVGIAAWSWRGASSAPG